MESFAAANNLSAQQHVQGQVPLLLHGLGMHSSSKQAINEWDVLLSQDRDRGVIHHQVQQRKSHLRMHHMLRGCTEANTPNEHAKYDSMSVGFKCKALHREAKLVINMKQPLPVSIMTVLMIM